VMNGSAPTLDVTNGTTSYTGGYLKMASFAGGGTMGVSGTGVIVADSSGVASVVCYVNGTGTKVNPFAGQMVATRIA